MKKKSNLPRVDKQAFIELVLENLTDSDIDSFSGVGERGEVSLRPHQRRTDIMQLTTRAPTPKGLRDQTFEVPINEVPKS